LVSFTWSGTPKSNNYIYRLYLDSTSATTEIYSGTATNYSVQEPLAEGTYYWKVSITEEGYTITSPIFTFTISTSGARALNLLVPANGSILESKNVKFEWTGRELEGLRFELFVGDKINSMRSSWSGTSRSVTLTLELKENVTYYWCVKGKNSDGNYIISSDIYTFEYKVSFAPVATLCAPLSGSIVSVSNVELIYDATDPDTPKDEINFKVYLDETNATTQIYEGKDRKQVVNLENGKKYYWRVEASDGKKRYLTEIWNFTADANMQPKVLPKITLTKPMESETINTNNVTFSWTASNVSTISNISNIPSANEDGNKDSKNLKYKLFLDSTDGNTLYKETNETNIQVSLSYGIYFWKVEVHNGIVGRISEIRHFFVTAYNESTPPTIPIILEPSEGDVFSSNEVNFVVRSQDPNGKEISYAFQFATSPNFSNARTETSKSGDLSISFDPGTYYWHVKASNGVRESSWSRTQTFTIDTHLAGLGVVLISPENGSKVKTLTTRLIWSINTRANALYKVYLSEDQSAVLNCHETACIRENTYQLNISSGFLKNGKRYYWTVVPIANRAWGVCRSGVFYFDTEIPSSQFSVKSSVKSASVGDKVTIKVDIENDLLPEGNVEYYFDFGDGTNSGWVSNNSVTHKFGTSGKYNVKVKARSNTGGVWTESSEYKTEISVSGGFCGMIIWYGAVFIITLFLCTVSSRHARNTQKEQKRIKKFFLNSRGAKGAKNTKKLKKICRR